MLEDLKSILTQSASPGTLVECRHCGTKLAPDTAECTACGGSEVARYQLDA
ncbi:hypothetical protein [Halocalculus aciditolerans]|uniref:Zinc-ribbon domain-containing protein n=1 Tax=Halocalculus aciditolerans TaxID=1383812 RepID=A0A830FPJ8_9EURY|nr:hypothetical protein [Halocalculus aciditolerans]GGL67807.1 hypothetical protein GCM10009039_27230 [Halocalculus aciditolerans]